MLICNFITMHSNEFNAFFTSLYVQVENLNENLWVDLLNAYTHSHDDFIIMAACVVCTSQTQCKKLQIKSETNNITFNSLFKFEFMGILLRLSKRQSCPFIFNVVVSFMKSYNFPYRIFHEKISISLTLTNAE